ncbi:MAG: MarR family transcriptional regulator [Lachnospiraceae bacterium]|nr:MarR family transcriptional regulator [Lachnospiraceae bacterium]
MNIHDTVNDILVNLFREILVVEENAIITGEFKNITVNDMHIIEAVGLDGRNMSAIAKSLGITVGSLTTSMNGLVKKEYVIRERSEEDRRVVMIRLSEKGERAYSAHKKFHDEMTEAVIASIEKEDIPTLTNVLQGLIKFFREYHPGQ